MPRGDEARVVVVPIEARAAALRVPDHVRALLGVDVFTVDQNGRIVHEPAKAVETDR